MMYLTLQHKLNSAFILCVLYCLNCQGVVVTELMPRPRQAGEWLELYNNSNVAVDLHGWQIEDASGQSCEVIILDAILEAFSFAVLAENESTLNHLNLEPTGLQIVCPTLPPLNDAGDRLVLRNPTGTVVDLIEYGSDLTSAPGISIERAFTPNNSSVSSDWGNCSFASGHSAGQPNSFSTLVTPTTVHLNADPNPFSPDGDDCDETTRISFQLPTASSRISIQIFDSYGRLVRRLASNQEATFNSPFFIWNGRTDTARLLTTGRYIIVLEAIDTDRGKGYAGRCTVVLVR